jgi:internalin A
VKHQDNNGAWSSYSFASSFTTVIFPDANLEAVIREAIGKPTGSIYASDLAGLTNLDAYSRGIADLTGMEYCTSLTYLDLWGNQISDISPLSSLTSLTALGLYENQISDISPLSSLTSLTWLFLWGNQISDISPLVDNEGLSSGDTVDLQGNPLSAESLNTLIPQLQARGVEVIS